jgi:hypothetical protein
MLHPSKIESVFRMPILSHAGHPALEHSQPLRKERNSFMKERQKACSTKAPRKHVPTYEVFPQKASQK